MRKGETWLVILILGLAVVLRAFALETVPGLHSLEAARGLSIAAGGGAHGVFSAAQSASVHLLGSTASALRLPAVVAGVLTVLAVYLLARRLFDSRELALMAGALAASGFWGILVSRVGLSAVMPAFWAAWGFFFLYKGIETTGSGIGGSRACSSVSASGRHSHSGPFSRPCCLRSSRGGGDCARHSIMRSTSTPGTRRWAASPPWWAFSSS